MTEDVSVTKKSEKYHPRRRNNEFRNVEFRGCDVISSCYICCVILNFQILKHVWYNVWITWYRVFWFWRRNNLFHFIVRIWVKMEVIIEKHSVSKKMRMVPRKSIRSPRSLQKCQAQPVLQHVLQTKETCSTPPSPAGDKRIAQVILVVKNFGLRSIACKPTVIYNRPAIAGDIRNNCCLP